MKTRMLVVDGCADNLKFISQIIAADHVELHFAQSEDEALRMILNAPYALVLMASQMPMMGGVELTRLFRKLKTKYYVPVLLLDHGNGVGFDDFDAYNVGVVDHLPHPINVHALKNKVDVFVRLDQQRHLEKEDGLKLNLPKDHFIAMISHELRAPLSSVIGFAEVLKNKDYDEEDLEDMVSAILRNGEMMLRLVDDILIYSSMEAGKLALSLKTFELCRFLRNIQTDLEMRAKVKGLDLIFDMPDREIFVCGDAVRIRQMIFNLLGNSLKFTHKGWVRLSLKVLNLGEASHRVSQRKLIFKIEDSGVGISPEGVEQLFKPFGQVDAGLKRSREGTGLGLAISRQLARIMGGDIKLLASEPGYGSAFEISIIVQDQEISPSVLDVLPSL